VSESECRYSFEFLFHRESEWLKYFFNDFLGAFQPLSIGYSGSTPQLRLRSFLTSKGDAKTFQGHHNLALGW
jgi:hypothetical protein